MSLPELREAGVSLALATVFTAPVGIGDHGPASYPANDIDAAEAAGRMQLEVYRQLESQGELSVVRSSTDLNDAHDRHKPQVVLLMEGADPIRSPSQTQQWFDDGIRLVGLTWAAGTRYAGGNHIPGPLTTLGAEMICALDELDMIHDLSHLADEAFEAVMAAARGPVVATHSNCRVITGENQRHLRDDQIMAIAGRDGIIGLNLFSMFLVPQGRATISDCVAHLQRITELMGHRRGVGLGSDMDGGFGPESLPIGLDHPGKLGALAEALADAGWSEQDIQGFQSENWRRFLHRNLPR